MVGSFIWTRKRTKEKKNIEREIMLCAVPWAMWREK